MPDDQIFSTALTLGYLIVLPIAAYHRIKSQATREPLDRREEGLFILATLRPVALILVGGVIAYCVNPARMAWASVSLPLTLRWAGIGLLALDAVLLFWTLHALGRNLTDTVVTRREHSLVTTGPYRWIRHPFYACVALLILSTSLAAANWFFLVTGVLFLCLLLLRTRTEEEKLVARFGDAYRRYMAETGRFFPRMRRRSPGVDSRDSVEVG